MHFLTITDITPATLMRLVLRALELKQGTISQALAESHVAMLFEKPSLRTKLSFMVGIERLGGKAIYFAKDEVGLGEREPIADVANVLSRMVEAVVIRTFSQRILQQFAEASSVPVVNALTDTEHPCQALADVMTIYEHLGDIAGLKVVYIGDANNVARSLMYAVIGLGGEMLCASPESYSFSVETIADAETYATAHNGTLGFDTSPQQAVENAAVVYTDVWTSMGQEHEAANKKPHFQNYQVTPELMSMAKPNAVFMHDMPAHPGEEISDGMLYHPQSICFTQAENRMWAQMALLEFLISGTKTDR